MLNQRLCFVGMRGELFPFQNSHHKESESQFANGTCFTLELSPSSCSEEIIDSSPRRVQMHTQCQAKKERKKNQDRIRKKAREGSKKSFSSPFMHEQEEEEERAKIKTKLRFFPSIGLFKPERYCKDAFQQTEREGWP